MTYTREWPLIRVRELGSVLLAGVQCIMEPVGDIGR